MAKLPGSCSNIACKYSCPFSLTATPTGMTGSNEGWLYSQVSCLTARGMALSVNTITKNCFKNKYRNFRPITRTADYPQRSIFVVRGKKVQQITRTGLLPAPQNKRKSCYCTTGIRTHKLGEMNIPCCCLQSERSITFSAKNWLLTMQP